MYRISVAWIDIYAWIKWRMVFVLCYGLKMVLASFFWNTFSSFYLWIDLEPSKKFERREKPLNSVLRVHRTLLCVNTMVETHLGFHFLLFTYIFFQRNFHDDGVFFRICLFIRLDKKGIRLLYSPITKRLGPGLWLVLASVSDEFSSFNFWIFHL